MSATLSLIITLSGCASLEPATPTPQPVVLTFAYDGNVSDYQALADQYQKLNPNITIKLAPVASGDFRGFGRFNQRRGRCNPLGFFADEQ